MTKVLLVEDDATMRSLLETLLQIEGFDVAKLVEFNNVINDIRGQAPQVVLMDVHLEEVDGIELVEELRQDAGLNGVKIIMSSGMDWREKCLEKGANDFILKPYMPDELIGKIKLLAGSEQTL